MIRDSRLMEPTDVGGLKEKGLMGKKSCSHRLQSLRLVQEQPHKHGGSRRRMVVAKCRRGDRRIPSGGLSAEDQAPALELR